MTTQTDKPTSGRLSRWQRPSSNIFVQLLRYGISGGVAFAVDFLLMVALRELADIPEVAAGTISFGIGLIITYLFSIFWIFDKRRMRSVVAEFITFAIIGAVGLLLTYWLMSLFVNSYAVNYMLAKIITTVIVTLWNFIAKKLILFRQ